MFFPYILLGRIIMFITKLGNLGSGSTWPGHVVLKLYPNFLKDITKNSKTKVVLVLGTNGKTTTSSMIATILEGNHKTVFQNNSGANLTNGAVSSFIAHASMAGKIKDEYVVLEVDENNLLPILRDITPRAIVILNLFRDQLDRYGELDSIARRWSEALSGLTPATNLFLNADDPLVASLGQNTNAPVYYFGLNDETIDKVHQHASDSIYCPLCKKKLTYTKIYYSHLGHWSCPNCKFARPEPSLTEISSSLPGTYNKYNALAAGLLLMKENISFADIDKGMKSITAVFGRQEKIKYKGKEIQIFLSKNPTSFNQSLKAVLSALAPNTGNLLIILNDGIPDGRDVSWIWDIDFENLINNFARITVAGDRVYDMVLRLQYAQEKYEKIPARYQVEPNLKKAVEEAIKKTGAGETLYVLPTYSAMLQVRKILTGRKIL